MTARVTAHDATAAAPSGDAPIEPGTPQRVPLLSPDGWRLVRRIALTVFAIVTAWSVAVDGVSTNRLVLTGFVVLALLLTQIGTSWRHFARVVVDWLPFTAVLELYDRSRGVADRLGMPLHDADVARLETHLFGGTAPTVWLQGHLYDAARPEVVHWYDAACTLVYTSHFLATPILAAVLWLQNREQWVRFVSRVIALSLAGLATYILFPEAPPWLASQHGYLPPVVRLSGRGWIWLHAGNLDSLLSRAQTAGANPVAAMPSLHTAFAVLVAIFIADRLHSRWRWLLVLYPLAMGFTLVYTGEHYVLDLVAGVAYALVVHLGFDRWERRRAAASVGTSVRP